MDPDAHPTPPPIYSIPPHPKPIHIQWALKGMDLATGKDVLDFQFYPEFGARNIFANPVR